ncbi:MULTISPECIES: TetR/AcrR family transcriptional regulator [unclassified Streptomyces]|uniref:TetR/AcrR family transcriptional regulator n=1 Tax=unclassified Streptomyces TaxID=2593676 RepID=UPI00225440A6|nr:MULTISPECIES: TetR/AcrR family transcriptional regulator [unclassified Streptomyces]MCX4641993.1 TetR/AcrR family transcriptional regulator [Streptomyces sp. NBC_01446]MCX5085725.1 TetR/AcrR family transcriptional regulator [Streptomyces sp. NBC_00401]MCX5326866.1 TetR/AcrR family transcriptional regulator [Streptomyces sp. NBC_00120]
MTEEETAAGEPGEPTAGSGKRRQRRQPSDPGRQRDPVGTRRAILAAAGAEFGTHGFDGARVVRIAEAAGVSHQLITYYFGGKRGLYEALSERWLSTAMPVSHELPFAEAVRRYIRMAHEDPGWVHTLTREQPGMRPPAEDDRATELLKSVEDLRARQARGEIRDDIDVGVLSLVFFAASVAPVALPWIAREFTQQDPASQEFVDHYAEQVAQIIAALGDVTVDGRSED